MAPETISRFGDLQIPASCPSCGARHRFYYRWLHHSGGYCCPDCDRIVAIDLVELDAAIQRLDAAIQGVRDTVNRVGAAQPAIHRPAEAAQG